MKRMLINKKEIQKITTKSKIFEDSAYIYAELHGEDLYFANAGNYFLNLILLNGLISQMKKEYKIDSNTIFKELNRINSIQ